MSTTDLAKNPPDPRTIIVYELLDRIRERVRRWLRLPTYEQVLSNHQELISGQRSDFDALARVLSVRDLDKERIEETMGGQSNMLSLTVAQLHRTTQVLEDVQDRLLYYEREVPLLAKGRKALDAARKKEYVRREALVKEHPELSAEGRAHVMRTGKLPETEPAKEDLEAPVGLRLVPDDPPSSPEP